MKLEQLLEATQFQTVVGSTAKEITGLTCDSRQVAPGMVFFALPGQQVDGFTYLPQAIVAGAHVIIAEQLPAVCEASICYVQVANVRLAMAQLAAKYYGNPTVKPIVIGITGTNGKTTVSYLLEAIFKQAGYSPAVFGTIEYRYGQSRYDASHTTPESIELLRMMADFCHQGADVLILEVSSHALEQHRVDGICFDAGVFTNLTQDHLDYHFTLERYFESKKRLFTELLPHGFAIINSDDSWGSKLIGEVPQPVSFGQNGSAQVCPQKTTVGRDGIVGNFVTPNGSVAIKSGMIGGFNVSNLLASVATAQQFGIDSAIIATAIATAPQVPGRVEKIKNNKNALVLVDYAHTPDALEQVLKTISQLDGKRILTVVGCGGDRDKTKRPLMAAVAVKYSNLTIFTSDNPRTENPLEILEQVKAGAVGAGSSEIYLAEGSSSDGFVVVTDRREAIELAVKILNVGDILLVAGKGHEDYQIVGTEKIHFDDREELKRLFKSDAVIISVEAGVADCV